MSEIIQPNPTETSENRPSFQTINPQLARDISSEIIRDHFTNIFSAHHLEHALLETQDPHQPPLITCSYQGMCPLYSPDGELLNPENFSHPLDAITHSRVGSKFLYTLWLIRTIACYGKELSGHSHTLPSFPDPTGITGYQTAARFLFADRGVISNNPEVDSAGTQQLLTLHLETYFQATHRLLGNEVVNIVFQTYSDLDPDYPLFIPGQTYESLIDQIINSGLTRSIDTIEQLVSISFPFYLCQHLNGRQGKPRQRYLQSLRRPLSRLELTPELINEAITHIEQLQQLLVENIPEVELNRLNPDEINNQINQILASRKKHEIDENTFRQKISQSIPQSPISVLEALALSNPQQTTNLLILIEAAHTSIDRQFNFNSQQYSDLRTLLGTFGFATTRGLIDQYHYFDPPQRPGDILLFADRFSSLIRFMNSTNPALAETPRIDIDLGKNDQDLTYLRELLQTDP